MEPISRWYSEPLKRHLRPDGSCYIWTGAVTHNGYGSMRIRGKGWRAHRLVYSIYIGMIPKGMFVLHRCDNRLCCNPEHLWLGTAADNSRDMVRKGRSYKGKRGKGNTKLSADNVAEIRALRDELGMVNCAELGRHYGVHTTTIHHILSGSSW